MITTTTALAIAMALTVVGLIAASVRLVLGPSRADRIVSLDLVTVLLVAIAAQLSMLYEISAYLDMGLAIGLIGFLATVAFARYVERSGNQPDDFEDTDEKPLAGDQATENSSTNTASGAVQ